MSENLRFSGGLGKEHWREYGLNKSNKQAWVVVRSIYNYATMLSIIYLICMQADVKIFKKLVVEYV